MSAVAEAQIAIVGPVVIDAINGAPSPDFLLTAACCSWPPSEAHARAIRIAAKRVTDWNRFLRVVQRQRVVTLVQEALRTAAIEVPPGVAAEIDTIVQRHIRHGLKLAAESRRLQSLLTAAGIANLVLKGVAVERLAYGSISAKQTRDIDLLVPPECAEAALALLEHDGYTLSLPAPRLSTKQRRALIRYAHEIELVDPRTKVQVELQWRVADNPLLLKSVDAHAASQTVILSEGSAVRTLAPDHLFAYLCVHGARHSWSRLKWLADLNALIASTNAGIEHLYRHAQRIGAGICAGQALLLCKKLFGLKLPDPIARDLEADRRCQRLVAIAMATMTAPYTATDRDEGIRGVLRELRNRFLLGRGLRFYLTECRLALIGEADIVRLPLPRPLHFIYPLVRLPMWLWRRLKLAWTPSRLSAG